MRNFGMVGEHFEESLELYFQQCSVLVTCHDLAVMGATLANGGVNPVTGERAIRAEFVKDLLSIMLTCGMYDYAGEWAFRVGLPAKSGVAGGVVAVVPGRLGIGIFSPRLDAKGNSVRGVKVCEELSRRFGLHAFESSPPAESLGDQLAPRRAR
jgi:glutaminase